MVVYGHHIAIPTSPDVFGDGNHETTRFLLYFLNRYVEGRTMLDVGCGSGILSVFASKRGALSVTAIDCDSNAIECTKRNTEENGTDITIISADINQPMSLNADIVSANFARWDALDNLPYLEGLVSQNGFLITTWYKELPNGVLEEKFEVVDYIEGIEYDSYVLRKTYNRGKK